MSVADTHAKDADTGERESSLVKFVRATLSTAGLSIVRLLTGWVKAKAVSLLLGTSGIGILAQATQVLQLATSIGSLGLVNGLIGRLSYCYANNLREGATRAFSTVLTLQAISISVILIIGFTGANALSPLAFGEPGHNSIFLLTLLAVPFAVLSSNFVEAVFFAKSRYDIYTKAGIWATLLGQAAVVVLAFYYGITGAILGAFLSAVILLVMYIYYLSGLERLGNVFRFGIYFDVLRDTASHGFVNLIFGALVPLGALVVRSIVVKNCGVSDNGIYQVPIALTAYYTPFVTNGLWARLHPVVSSGVQASVATQELNVSLRHTAVVVTGFVMLLLVYPEALVLACYSSDFMLAVDVMPVQFSGDLGYFVLFNVGVFALALNRLRAYCALWLVYYFALIGFSIYLVPQFGLRGAANAYLISANFVALLSLLWILSDFRYRDLRVTLGVITACGLLIAVQASLFAWSQQIWVRFPLPVFCVFVAVAFAVLSGKLFRKGKEKPSG